MVKGKTSRYANDRHTLSISTISPYSYTSFPSPSPYLLSPSLPSLATTPLLLPQAHVVSTAHVLYQTNKAQTQSALGTSTLNRLVHLPAATTRNPMSAARYLEEHQGASWSQFIIIMALFCAKQSSENQSTREYPLSELAVISSKQLHPNHYLEPFMPVFHIPSSPLTPDFSPLIPAYSVPSLRPHPTRCLQHRRPDISAPTPNHSLHRPHLTNSPPNNVRCPDRTSYNLPLTPPQPSPRPHPLTADRIPFLAFDIGTDPGGPDISASPSYADCPSTTVTSLSRKYDLAGKAFNKGTHPSDAQ